MFNPAFNSTQRLGYLRVVRMVVGILGVVGTGRPRESGKDNLVNNIYVHILHKCTKISETPALIS